MTNHPPSAAAHTLAAGGPQAWLGWLWRLLLIGVVLGVMGGCSRLTYSGDATQPPTAAADGQVKMDADRVDNSDAYTSYIVLRNQSEPTKFIAYKASIAAPSAEVLESTPNIMQSSTFTPSKDTLDDPNTLGTLPIDSFATTLSPSLVYTVVEKGASFTRSQIAAVTLPYNHAIYSQLANANPGYEPVKVYFSAYSRLDGDSLHSVDISLPTGVDKIALANGANQLTGSTVSASFKVTGLNSAASTRTIDWTVKEGTTTLLTASTVCSGVQGTTASATNETCTSNNPALSLAVENPSSAKLSLAFAGKAGGQYQVSSKASYPVSTTSVPKRIVATTRNFPSGNVNVADVAAVAQITTSVAFIALNQEVEFDTAGSAFPKGSKVYFTVKNSVTGDFSPLVPRGAKLGEIVTKPKFVFTAKSDVIYMVIDSDTNNTGGQKTLDIKKLFTPVTGGSS